ncbi:3-oxoacyl-[acyl-carrier-protein] reductase FabG [bacterium HR11]|nr:3-oxoacyl-[acyl-carrier-protein] reductase FabG [bacterium HR11]
MEIRMDGRVVWVTGGSSGLGRAMVRRFAEAGATVVWNHWGDPMGEAEQARWFEAHGYPTYYREADVTDPTAVEAFVQEVVRRYGTVHVLVNNAGIRADAVTWKMRLEDWHRVLEVNLTGAFLCSRAVIPLMRAQKWGRIIHISSINALRGKFGQGNYAASKAGLIGFAKALAREVAAFGITVNVVAPGMVMTPLTQTLPEPVIEEARREAILGFFPEPDDVAAAVLFLASDWARCITGEVLRVDSGQCL